MFYNSTSNRNHEKILCGTSIATIITDVECYEDRIPKKKKENKINLLQNQIEMFNMNEINSDILY
jgi:hypothetical protein